MAIAPSTIRDRARRRESLKTIVDEFRRNPEDEIEALLADVALELGIELQPETAPIPPPRRPATRKARGTHRPARRTGRGRRAKVAETVEATAGGPGVAMATSILKANPGGLTTPEVGRLLYGDGDANATAKARALLNGMGRKGVARTTGGHNAKWSLTGAAESEPASQPSREDPNGVPALVRGILQAATGPMTAGEVLGEAEKLQPGVKTLLVYSALAKGVKTGKFTPGGVRPRMTYAVKGGQRGLPFGAVAR